MNLNLQSDLFTQAFFQRNKKIRHDDGINFYVYVGNDPVNSIDVYGYRKCRKLCQAARKAKKQAIAAAKKVLNNPVVRVISTVVTGGASEAIRAVQSGDSIQSTLLSLLTLGASRIIRDGVLNNREEDEKIEIGYYQYKTQNFLYLANLHPDPLMAVFANKLARMSHLAIRFTPKGTSEGRCPYTENGSSTRDDGKCYLQGGIGKTDGEEIGKISVNGIRGGSALLVKGNYRNLIKDNDMQIKWHTIFMKKSRVNSYKDKLISKYNEYKNDRYYQFIPVGDNVNSNSLISSILKGAGISWWTPSRWCPGWTANVYQIPQAGIVEDSEESSYNKEIQSPSINSICQ